MDDEDFLVLESYMDEEDKPFLQTNSSSSDTDSDSDDEMVLKERRTCSRVKNISDVISHYDDLQFKENFRVQRKTFRYLAGLLHGAHIFPTHTYGRKKVDSDKAFLMTLWYIGNTESYRQISERFDVTRSRAHILISKVVNFLVKLSPKYIIWPRAEKAAEIVNGFYNKKGINGVQGVIDGCHIKINKPKHHQGAYCNRKGIHSILLQGVADHHKRFIDIFCGEAGSIHDSRLLKKSALYEKAQRGELLPDKFLLGDSAYPSLRWLVPPFKDNGNLTQNQNIFNYRHSTTRIIIENSFGLLKGRFRRLKFFENIKIDFIVKTVIAACVLHNICINFDDLDIPYDSDNFEDQQNDDGHEYFQQDFDRREELFNQMLNQ